ncbi:wd-40 repeat protein [Stylonychia lemnae]|uniref:Wd-40 repeat protein n=1 Tax=Stylonychia lemnae TaxID=5949 RepID=A0A078ARC1_STYLE|nr:wd-40 repeat protein [Stylonychia lemnae]|eukprot:CDW84531.1 wd-40 repeat protein [Stylonychia lemnae]
MQQIQGFLQNTQNDFKALKASFSKKYLSEQCTPKQFLKNIQYNVEVSNLIKIVKTCFYHENMNFCPIIVQIQDPQIMKVLGNSMYLMVYNRQGKLVYQRSLKYDLVSWNIFHQYLVIKLDPREGETHILQVIFLEKDAAILKIKDFAPNDTYRYLGVNNEVFYYGSDNNIKMIDIKKNIGNGQIMEIEIGEPGIVNYDIPYPNRLLQFLENGYSKDDQYMLCAIETEDNQFDFTREVVPRELRQDPIKTFSFVIKANEFLYGVSVRKSGQADFYWNYTMVNSSTSDELFEETQTNFDSIFLKHSYSNMIYEVDLKNDIRVGTDVAVNYTFMDNYWDGRKYSLIRDHVKLFTSFTLANTSLFVSYLNFVSVYDVISKQFRQHLVFKDQCMKLFRTERTDYNSSQGGQLSNGIIGVHLSSGVVALIEPKMDEITGNDDWQLTGHEARIDGQIETIVSDTRDFASHFIFVNDNGKKKLFGFKIDTVTEVSSQVNLKNEQYLIKFISSNVQEDFGMYDTNKSVITTFINTISYNDSFTIYEGSTFNLPNPFYVYGKIHTVVKSKEEKHLFIFDDQNLYIYDIEKSAIIDVKKDQNIKNLQLIDDKYIYAVMNKSKELGRQSGFYFQNLDQLISKSEQAQTFRLKNALVGQLTFLSYFRNDERMAYMSDYESIKIIPVLHRNTISFFGIRKKENYVLFKKNQDKLIALDYDNVLSTYSIATGKILMRHKLANPVIKKSQRIWASDPADITYKNPYYYPRTLLYDQDPVTDVNDEEYFDERLKCDLEKCTAYTKILQKNFHKFSVIEIMSETEVKIHYEFIHVIFQSEPFQRIYISDDLEYMIERLQNQRVFMYRAIKSATEGQIKWVIIRRIKQFPKDISDFSGYNYLFSPNLQYYLDFDFNDACYQIKKTIDQTIYREIPRGLLTTDDKYLLARKFMWIDNFRIRLVNIEGVEKVLDIHDNMKQLSYGTVPMLNNDDFIRAGQNPSEVGKGHFFYDQTEPDVSAIEQRLRIKFQDYFRAYFVDNKKTPEQLYDVLFKVDYSQEKPLADLSFSYFHWKLAETLAESKKKMKVKQFSHDEIRLLVLNIFPLGNTITHLAVKNVGAIRKIYQIVRNLNTEGRKFEIPFINNFLNQTPLHLCMIGQNYKSADLILQNLIDTPLDSHIRGILDVLPDLIKNDIPSLKDYLDGRFIQTDQIKAIRRGAINYAFGNEEYAVNSCELWPDRLTVEDKLFTKSTLDAEIKLEFLDIPSVHSYTGKVGEEFFQAMANSKNMDLFACRSVQAIIDYKWPLVREYTIKLLFAPFIFYHCAWITYSNVFNGQVAQDTDEIIIADKVLSAILYVFSIYFLVNEVRQILNQGFTYMISVWNYTDILPPIFIITVVSLHLIVYYKSKDDESYDPNNFIETIHSIACLLMWAKFLYFLRIFYSTGYLIRMLSNVVWDMKVFLLILFLVYFGFGEAFLRLSENSDPEASFIKNYAYCWVYAFRLSMGDTAADTFNDTIQPITLWIIWCICLLLTNIVMLNMLIAIIGESFGTVNSMQKQANYQERSRIIAENDFLIPKYRKREMRDELNYLITAIEITEQEEIDSTKVVQDQFVVIEESLNKIKTEITEKHNSLEGKVDQIVAKYYKKK